MANISIHLNPADKVAVTPRDSLQHTAHWIDLTVTYAEGLVDEITLFCVGPSHQAAVMEAMRDGLAASAMRDALKAIARGLTNGQLERGETPESIARAALGEDA